MENKRSKSRERRGTVDTRGRKIIGALQVSLDGLIEGPNGELDWIGSWEDTFDLLPEIDTFVLGGGMYPGYEQYWGAVLANPEDVLPFTGKVPTKGEVEYARFAQGTPHVVLSRTLDTVAWKTTRILRDVEGIRALKQQPGKHIHAVGGASLVSTLMNAGLVDQLRLTVHPVVLGKGKALFGDVEAPHPLELLETRRLPAGRVGLSYGLGAPSSEPGLRDIMRVSSEGHRPAWLRRCARHDSNMRPLPPQGSALSPELRARVDLV